MNRSNLFTLAPTREQHHVLQELGVNCAKLWNEVNYLHHQQYGNYLRLDWNPRVYKKYVPLVGSATAQQVVRKNNEAWRAFLALKRMKKNGKLPSTIRRVKRTMVHNYRSHKYVADRLGWTAEEYGMKVRTVSEAYTSQTCPRCHSRHSQRVLRGFRCLDCGLEAHGDAVGVVNMAARCGGYAVRPMVWPMLLRWDGCGWNRNNGMPTLERIRVEA